MNFDAAILIALKILAVLALVLLNGFFVAAEFSLVRIRETQLDMLVAKNCRRAKMARHIVRNLNSYLSATQLGITMVSLGLGYLGEPIFTSLLAPMLSSVRRGIRDVGDNHFARRRFQRADIFERRRGRTCAEMADDSKAAARRAVVGVSVALVLRRAVSVQPAAEPRAARFLVEQIGIAPRRHRRPARNPRRNCASCSRPRKARRAGATSS